MKWIKILRQTNKSTKTKQNWTIVRQVTSLICYVCLNLWPVVMSYFSGDGLYVQSGPDLVKTFESAMNCVGAVVSCQLVLGTVQSKTRLCNSVGKPPNQRTEIRMLSVVSLNIKSFETTLSNTKWRPQNRISNWSRSGLCRFSNLTLN